VWLVVGGVETAHHLFLACLVFAPLWSMIRLWVDFSSGDPFLIRDHFVQFILFAGVSRARRLFIQLLWLCTIWVIWQEHNNRIFKVKKTYVLHLLDKVKVHSLWWMKAYNVNLGLNSHMWSSPLVCMGIG
jgi:hypothetical protein